MTAEEFVSGIMQAAPDLAALSKAGWSAKVVNEALASYQPRRRPEVDLSGDLLADLVNGYDCSAVEIGPFQFGQELVGLDGLDDTRCFGTMEGVYPVAEHPDGRILVYYAWDPDIAAPDLDRFLKLMLGCAQLFAKTVVGYDATAADSERLQQVAGGPQYAGFVSQMTGL